ncbi:hypothetical protein CC85DRAFT_330278 [Cutaneotrichosporon oleaginosum]|uniref:GSKIP domain-containing protein n=1 Tax=Cutaneotrichosporon oleaginosum TaxID=879819 RepID=A0A0J0XFW7_9TREE|nr:uncharacterized protein CC85DRAFT_330278 [Cutaneotrichosporon oleaginosum]KLT39965.1 hypothetical protein CC85DRAFT_330278 [Cutaneotrichosporon oleaginosum]TXT14154.1 hypothetical protein COLE_00347 [Cutaneotrichosporon oleaginosum]
MSSPPPSNILEDPIGELEAAIRAHAFGIDPLSHVLVGQSYPRTNAERIAVASEARSNKQTPESVRARAKVVLLENEGEAEIVLDQRGYTIESTTATTDLTARTFESFDALLIALSPAYVRAMNAAVAARFAEGVPERRYHSHEDEDEEEPKWID